MSGNFKRENREILMVSKSQDQERPENASGGTAGMHAMGKSDDFVVPTKRTNKAAAAAAESVEERRSPQGSDGALVCTSDTEPN